MNTYQDLRRALDLGAGSLTVSGDKLGANVERLLGAINQGQSIVIAGAAYGAGDGAGDAVVVTGTAAFLGVADLPVTARFFLADGGQAGATLRFRLRDAAPGPTAWTFSRSFPKLPVVWDFSTGTPDHHGDAGALPAQRAYLDALDLYDTELVAATHAGADATGATLASGLNFVSRLRPQGAVGLLEHALGDGKPLLAFGPIRVPRPTDRTVGLELWQRPWDRDDAPGITLKAPLDLRLDAGGKLTLDGVALRVYSPPSTDWMDANDSWKPMHGYTATLAIPSAGVRVDLSADLEWNLPRAWLRADCSGVTLGKLAQLVDLAGGGALSKALPQEIQGAADALGKLELLDVALLLAAKDDVPTVAGVAFTVGLTGLTWKVFGDDLVVRDIRARFETGALAAPGSSLTASLMGTVDIEGVPIEVIARGGAGFSLWARLAGGKTIPLTGLMKRFAPESAPPSELTVKTMSLKVQSGRAWAMALQVAGTPKPWVIPVGKSSVAVSDVSVDLARRSGGKTTGSIAGTASFGKILTLSVGYTLPGDVVVRGVFPKVNLTHLIEDLCDQKIALPGGFDVVLENASILMQKQGESEKLLAASSVPGFGLFAFEVRKLAAGGWGFAAGMDLGAAGPSKLAGLGALKAIEDGFKLQKLMLIASSFDDAGFTFPDMAQFNQAQLGAGKLAVRGAGGGVSKGLMLQAEWILDDGTKELRLLKGLLGLGGTQSATLAIGADPTKDARLFVTQKTTINKMPFNCQLGVALSGGKPSLFLTGTLEAKIQGQAQAFDVTTTFVPGGAFLAATMKGATGVDVGPFKLSNLALQIGADWAGVPSLGVAATIDVKSFSSSVAVFFDSTDPSRSLVAGSIGEIDAKEVLSAFLPGTSTPLDDVLKTVAIKGTSEFSIGADLADELDGIQCDKVAAAFAAAKVTIPSSTQQLAIVPKSKGASWHLTDLTTMRHYQLEKKADRIRVVVAPQFYFAPQQTAIGSIRFPQAFYLNAAISFAGFDASATVDIAQGKGISVQAQMDRIVILDEKLFSLAALQGGGGPKIDVSTFSQPAHPTPELRLPHFYINGAMTLLGVKQGVYASVSTAGIDFELVGQLVPGVKFDVDARFGRTGLEATGTLKVGVGTIDLGPLGKARVNTELAVDLDVDLDTGDGDGASVELQASFEFAGQRVDIPRFSLAPKADTFTQIPKTIEDKVGAALKDVFNDVNKWMNAVGKGAMDGVKDTEKVFKDVYKKTDKEAQQLASNMSKGLDSAGKAIEGAAKDVGKDANKVVNDVGKSAKKTFKKAKFW